jgi:hypothetical protein
VRELIHRHYDVMMLQEVSGFFLFSANLQSSNVHRTLQIIDFEPLPL